MCTAMYVHIGYHAFKANVFIEKEQSTQRAQFKEQKLLMLTLNIHFITFYHTLTISIQISIYFPFTLGP